MKRWLQFIFRVLRTIFTASALNWNVRKDTFKGDFRSDANVNTHAVRLSIYNSNNLLERSIDVTGNTNKQGKSGRVRSQLSLSIDRFYRAGGGIWPTLFGMGHQH